MTSTTCERLIGVPSETLDVLLADSEREGSRFVRRLVDEWATGANRFDRPGEALFTARIADRVVGICGLNVDPYAAANVGRVRRLYVLSAYRGLGVGRRLVMAVLQAARGRFDVLRLRTTNPAAARLYESLGFTPSTASECTHVIDLRSHVSEVPQS